MSDRAVGGGGGGEFVLFLCVRGASLYAGLSNNKYYGYAGELIEIGHVQGIQTFLFYRDPGFI